MKEETNIINQLIQACSDGEVNITPEKYKRIKDILLSYGLVNKNGETLKEFLGFDFGKVDYSKPVEPIKTIDGLIYGYRNIKENE